MMHQMTNLIDAMLSMQEKAEQGAAKGWQNFDQRSYPAVNLYQEEDQVIVTAEIPGFKSADLDLEVKGDQFHFTAAKKEEEIKGDYYFRERGKSSFDRSVKLPFKVDESKVSANFEDGVLTVTLSKAEAEKATKITLN